MFPLPERHKLQNPGYSEQSERHPGIIPPTFLKPWKGGINSALQGLNWRGDYTQGDGDYATSAPGFVIYAFQAKEKKIGMSACESKHIFYEVKYLAIYRA